MEYKQLDGKVREIIAECIEDWDINITDMEWGILEKQVASDVCLFIAANFELEADSNI